MSVLRRGNAPMTDIYRCLRCGAERPGASPEGLCPRCLMQNERDTDVPISGSGVELTVSLEPGSASVLARIAESIGRVPSVMLRDTEATTVPGPVAEPAATSVAGPAARIEKYKLFGEIARGGMGAVLRGRDLDLGRDLAVKVLLESHRDKPDLVKRFVEEAQIGGQLQHPGIVPVYELGAFADSRPYFTMKLVKGRTVADLLCDRTDPADERPRFLAIFAQVCQTMAYAHARGVIHRDLKPSNIMVGSFGEVQVMDWGLAKVLPRGGVADDADAGQSPAHETIIATARRGSEGERSLAGSVMGTPAYMAPEQARGEVGAIDERADVFALGSILCEVLTGEAAFFGRSAGEIHRNAALGDLGDAHARLNSCGADAELIALASGAMAREREDRPRDAGELAERVTAYLGSLELRLRQAELERAAQSARTEEAQARATVERSRRRRTVALAASLLLLAGVGGGGYAYDRSQVRERSANAALAVREVEVLYDQARKSHDDPQKWTDAHAAAAAAAGRLVADLDDPAARRRAAELIQAVEDGANAAAKDRELVATLIDIRSSSSDDRDGSATDAAYREAFRGARIDPDALAPAELAAKVRARPEAVAAPIASALDEWAAARREMRKDRAGSARLVAAVRAVDPDEWRGRLREALDLADRAARRTALLGLADSLGERHLPAVSSALMGKALRDVGERGRAEAVLRAGSQEHPRDVWVNYGLARTLEALGRRGEAIRYYMAARSIQPESAHELAHALEQSGQGEEAVAVFRDLVGLKPENGRHLLCLGRSLHSQGRAADEAAVLARAEAALRKAIALRPDDSEAQMNLGGALRAQGKRDEAIAAFRAAIRIDPDDSDAHLNLGSELQDCGQLVEAVAEHREAIRLSPDDSNAHNSLANDLNYQGKVDESIAEYRAAIRLRPDDVYAHYNLGNALRSQGKAAEAMAEYGEVIRLQPDLAEAHCNLAAELQGQGRFQEALAEHRKGHELGSRRPDWLYPSTEWVRQAERMAALEGRLQAVLRGDDKPRDAAEGLVFADLAYRTRRCGPSVRLYAEAFGADPKLAEDMSAGNRYNAACAAALASAGKGDGRPPLDQKAMAQLRKQAVAWLRADLTFWTKHAGSGPPQAKALVAQTLFHWKQDADLVGLRGEPAAKALPVDEHEACRALWAEVDALLARSQRP
jgi:serine/threonine protein kinase/tetratricopeptide (TPR) repeat protein